MLLWAKGETAAAAAATVGVVTAGVVADASETMALAWSREMTVVVEVEFWVCDGSLEP
jgi:hypothetical protein